MASVMLDNWGLSNCAENLIARSKESDAKKSEILHRKKPWGSYPGVERDRDICWQNFLTSLVLWDRVYLNLWETGFSYDACTIQLFLEVAREQLKCRDIIRTVKPWDYAAYVYSAESISQLYGHIEEGWRKSPRFELLCQSYQYHIQANVLGYNYLPHPRRASLLYESGIFRKEFDRTKYLDTLDKSVIEYIDKLNTLVDCQLKTAQFPLLYGFIASNAGDVNEELQVALELRQNRNVKRFRKSIDKIEKAYSEGNLMAVQASLLETKEICDTITSEMYSKPWSFGVSLAVSPSINIDGEVQGKVRSKLHTTFLYDLASFAIKGETKRKYKLDIK